MFDKLEKIETEFRELEQSMSDPAIIHNQMLYKKLGQRYSDLQPIVELYEKHRALQADLESAIELQKDSNDSELAEETAKLKGQLKILENQLKITLLPPDPNAKRNVIIELRAGAGGEEAALFTADLYRMYVRYAEDKKWGVELISTSASDSGGFKEIIFSLKGNGAFADFQYESGVHRVQRIPTTESQGRIHTSTVTCAVLPEAEEIDVELKDEDLRIDVFRAGGHGGQHVNTTDSAVRVTHIPTRLVVICQDEKSQLKNKQKALKVLRSRLLLAKQESAHKKEGELRRSQIKAGDRSEKIRTYNYPQNRVTDHRIKQSWNNLTVIMDGDIKKIIEALRIADQMEKLAG